ncbi:MAG: DUF5810 domain-containing protein [Haloarculaceae archaeon]
MGYACPVCGDPQADGEHLANHLAFTALLGDADHEDWLDDHAPDWGETDPAELADRVTDHADEREFPQVFEDTTGDSHAHDHDEGGRAGGVPEDAAPGGVAHPTELFDDDGERTPSDVLAEARELTERRRTNAGDAASTDGGDGAPAEESASSTDDGNDADPAGGSDAT